MPIRTKVRPLLVIALLLAWWLACWWCTGIWQDKAATQVYHDARQRTEQFVASSAVGYERIIATRLGLIRVLAREQGFRDALSQHSLLSTANNEDERRRSWNADPRLTAVNRQLAITAHDLGMRSIWLMDVNGDCIASSNAGEPTDHIGTRYADRDYFQAALVGRSAYQITNGRRQLGASISFSAPVADQHGRIIGVLAGGNDLATFTNWLDQAEAFFTDRYGVVVLATDPAMALRALPNAPVQGLDAATRLQLYKTSDIQTLSLPSLRDDQFPELLRFTDDTTAAILASRAVTDGELALHVLQPLPQLANLKHLRPIYAAAFGLIGSLLVLIFVPYASRRRAQNAMILALAQRDQQTAQAHNFLDQIVNAIADPLFVKDHEHRWVLVNQAFCKIYGQPREYFIGKVANDAFPEPVAQRIWDADERVLTAGIESVAEEKLTDSHGVTHIVVTKKAPYKDAAGQSFIVGTISDITERKQMERLLRAREREFRTLAEHNPDIIVRYDRNCQRTYVNQALTTLTGQEPDELFDLLHGDTPLINPEHYMAKLRKVVDSGEPSQFEVKVRRSNGETAWHAASIVPEFDEMGQVVGALTVARDITDRKRTEQQLQEALEFSNGIINALPDILFELDHEGRYLNVWAQSPQEQAAQRSALVGKQFCDVLSAQDAELAMAALREADENGFAYGKAISIVRPDGQTRWYEHSLSKKKGRTPSETTFLALSRDVTDTLQAQRHLRETRKRLMGVLQTMPDMVWLKDVKGVYQICNHAFSRLTGVAESDTVGRTDHDLFEPQLADHFRQQDLKAIEAGTVRINEEWADYANDGHRVLLETRRVPVYGAAGKLHGVLSIARDITELKNAEVALRSSEALTQSRNELLLAIMESSPDVIVFALDTSYRYLAFNHKHQEVMQSLWGKTISVRMNMLDIIGQHPDRQTVQQAMDRALAGESFVLEEAYGDESYSRQYWQNFWSPIRSGAGEVIGLTCFVLNISERRNAEERLRKSHDLLHALAMHQETEHEKHRKELAYQIHEDLAQNLAAVRMNLSFLAMGSNHIKQTPEFQTINEITERSIARIRDIVSVLRPTVLDLGLVPALEWLIEDFKGIGFHFDLALQEDIPLDDKTATMLFRAAQEALLNVALHAAATHIRVSLDRVANTCRLVVCDNGRGFTPAAPVGKGCFGLIGLTEQARHMGGEAIIESRPDRGTVLTIQMPIAEEVVP